jgi:hypothetical protein
MASKRDWHVGEPFVVIGGACAVRALMLSDGNGDPDEAGQRPI